MPADPRFPERDNEWLATAIAEKEELVNWLEDFRSKYEIYNEAQPTIEECESTIKNSTLVLEPIKAPLLIQNARLCRDTLPYGLDFHVKKLKTAVSIIFIRN